MILPPQLPICILYTCALGGEWCNRRAGRGGTGGYVLPFRSRRSEDGGGARGLVHGEDGLFAGSLCCALDPSYHRAKMNAQHM